MAGIRRVSDLGTQGVKTILDGSVQTADIANNAITQSKLASNLTGATIVTSSTRSSLIPSPFIGQICYETDTFYFRVWDGSNWDYLSKSQDDTIGLGPVGGLVYIGGTNLSTGQSYNITNVFSSTYRNYRVVGSFTRDTAGTSYAFIRIGGSATDHQMSGAYSTWNSPTRTGDNGNDGYALLTSEGANSFSADIHAPQLAQRTFYTCEGYGQDYVGKFTIRVNNNTQYTSFSFSIAVGNFTGGSLQVYGYRV